MVEPNISVLAMPVSSDVFGSSHATMIPNSSSVETPDGCADIETNGTSGTPNVSLVDIETGETS